MSSKSRTSQAPDVPTVDEAGVSGYDVGVWFGVLTVAGTPREIVQRLNSEVDKIVKDPEFVERLAQFGFSTSDAMTPDLLRMRVRTETELWRKIATDIELKPQ